MPEMFHVSSTANRESISAHGLDRTRMGASSGIAGSTRPEQNGIFLCRDRFDTDFFVRINNTGGPVDVWAIEDVAEDRLVPTESGWAYLPGPIAPERLRLARYDLPPADPAEADPARPGPDDGAYRSRLTIAFDDGRVLTGDAASEYARRVHER